MSTDLEERNARAVMQALNAQNAKLDEFAKKITAQAEQIHMLIVELEKLKKASIDDLVKKFNSGPTA